MKKLIYVIFILIFISCKNNDVNKVFENSVLVEEDSEVFEYSNNLESNKYQLLSTQKLEDYFDLIKLKEKYPEFKNDVFLQLRSLSNDSILKEYKGDFSIEDINQKGDTQRVSDSTQKIKLSYKVISESYTLTDSIYAIITSKIIQLDGIETVSNKIVFSKE